MSIYNFHDKQTQRASPHTATLSQQPSHSLPCFVYNTKEGDARQGTRAICSYPLLESEAGAVCLGRVYLYLGIYDQRYRDKISFRPFLPFFFFFFPFSFPFRPCGPSLPILVLVESLFLFFHTHIRLRYASMLDDLSGNLHDHDDLGDMKVTML